MPNPFRLYPSEIRDLATRDGIVADVAKSTGASRSAVSRTFSGITIRARPAIVKALNCWLIKNGHPAAETGGKSARSALNELRKKACR